MYEGWSTRQVPWSIEQSSVASGPPSTTDNPTPPWSLPPTQHKQTLQSEQWQIANKQTGSVSAHRRY